MKNVIAPATRGDSYDDSGAIAGAVPAQEARRDGFTMPPVPAPLGETARQVVLALPIESARIAFMPKMKAYASFDAYLKDQSPKNQTIIRALRRFVKRIAPKLIESVKWGNGCWINEERPVAYVYSDTGYVQFGFFNGASLKDPNGLLEGKGQYVRHIKVRARSGIDERSFAALLKQAVG